MEPQTTKKTRKETGRMIESYARELIEAGSLVMLLLLILLGVLLRSYTFALGIFVGGIVAIINHYGLYKSLRSVLSAAAERGEKGGAPQTLFAFYARLLFSGVVIFLALRAGFADPIGILVGASVVVVNSLIVGLAIFITDRGANG
jgi:hypothetical protein